jgi:hypothetical protein
VDRHFFQQPVLNEVSQQEVESTRELDGIVARVVGEELQYPLLDVAVSGIND